MKQQTGAIYPHEVIDMDGGFYLADIMNDMVVFLDTSQVEDYDNEYRYIDFEEARDNGLLFHDKKSAQEHLKVLRKFSKKTLGFSFCMPIKDASYIEGDTLYLLVDNDEETVIEPISAIILKRSPDLFEQYHIFNTHADAEKFLSEM